MHVYGKNAEKRLGHNGINKKILSERSLCKYALGEYKMNRDLKHLKLLSIFYYVEAGLVALYTCFLLILFFFVGMGTVIGAGVFHDVPRELQYIGVFPMVFVGLFILFGLVITAAIRIAGRNLAQRTRYTYCLVFAVVECFFVPFGTVLGVFTIIVLMRESVKMLFQPLVATDTASDELGT